MRAWPSPFVPAVPGAGLPLRVYDTGARAVRALDPGPVARMYVCGITPYDATHLGHAATYVTFDVLGRALRDAGHEVLYVQNVTDVDDPLLERARRDGIEWNDLAQREIALFQEDMTALAVIAPDHYVGVVEGVPSVVKAVTDLLSHGTAYRLELPEGEGCGAGAADVYFDLAQGTGFGDVSSWDRDQMLAVFADRGGDPGRPGKRDVLDPLLWRAAREGEPSWPGGELGDGRPGWHIECTTIALDYLGMSFDVQGGGTDLIFPHHEMSAVQASGLNGLNGLTGLNGSSGSSGSHGPSGPSGLNASVPFAKMYVHQSMVGLHGEKMSKSKGNLVLVSRLRRDGVEPMAIRLALLAHHYRTPWDWTDEVLASAQRRLDTWRAALSGNGGPPAQEAIARLRARLADDLDTPGALAAVDDWAGQSLDHGGDELGAPGLVGRAIDALLGIRL